MSVYALWPPSSLQYIFLSLWNNVTIIVCNTLPEIMQSNSSWIPNQNNLVLKRQKFLYWKCSWRLIRVTSIPRAIVCFTEVSQPLPVLTHIQEMKKEASVMSSFFIVSLNENTKFLPSIEFFTCIEMVCCDFLPFRIAEVLHQPENFNNLTLFPEMLVELCQWIDFPNAAEAWLEILLMQLKWEIQLFCNLYFRSQWIFLKHYILILL